MNLIRFAIQRPTAILAAVIMVVIFGAAALRTIPIQLTPDITRPVITVSTIWPGAAPADVERDIITLQEAALRGLEGLRVMSASAAHGRGFVALEFNVDTDMDRAFLLVSNRLDRVGGYPEAAEEPIIFGGTEDVGGEVARLVLTRVEGNETPIHRYGAIVEDVVLERFRRVEGVSEGAIYGGTEREMRIVVDPDRLARHGLTVLELMNTLQAANASMTAGAVEEGKRQYVVRVDSELDGIERVREVTVRSEAEQGPGAINRLTIGDVADVDIVFGEREGVIRFLGEEALAVFLNREPGTNVIEVLDGVTEALDELNAGPLDREGLVLRLTTDQTGFIDDAINLVLQNILVGGGLAALVLMIFLRSARATLVISIAIPVSVIGTFVAMASLGRSINVISLAGIAFAVGMVVDAAIVVLENIYRLRQQGLPAREAAARGAEQVWGAVLVSALTTVMVFIPLLVMDLEIGQLFRDIAVALSVSVVLSLLVAVTVIPALSSRMFITIDERPGGDRRFAWIDRAARGFTDAIARLASLVARARALGLALVVAIGAGAALFTWAFLPQTEYLPSGTQNSIVGTIVVPSGYNLDTIDEAAERIQAQLAPLFANAAAGQGANEDADDDLLSGGAAGNDLPLIENFFIVVTSGWGFMGATAVDEDRVSELTEIMQRTVTSEPGTNAFFRRESVFGGGLGGDRTIEVNVSGGELEQTITIARQVISRMANHFPPSQGHRLSPNPGLGLGSPEVRVVPDAVRLADAGVSPRDLALTVSAFNNGLRVAEISVADQRMDLILRGPDGAISQTQGIGDVPVVTRNGSIMPVSALARIENTAGPTSIRRLERQRTISLVLTPTDDIPLETAMDIVEAEVLAPLRADLPPGVTFSVTGTADALTQTWDAMVWDLALAMVIVYLVMAVLFESLFYPLIILISVPIALAGGVGGLALLNLYVEQDLDMLTMLGFVILIGIVVNNAILLVHQALYHYRTDHCPVAEAVVDATRSRIRPIFMSTLTSIFGMLPLVAFPGAGSELYRGLGAVVLGGLSLSAILTLVVVPPLMGLFMGLIEGAKERLAFAGPQTADRLAPGGPTGGGPSGGGPSGGGPAGYEPAETTPSRPVVADDRLPAVAAPATAEPNQGAHAEPTVGTNTTGTKPPATTTTGAKPKCRNATKPKAGSTTAAASSSKSGTAKSGKAAKPKSASAKAPAVKSGRTKSRPTRAKADTDPPGPAAD